jgi:microcystin degradation protein MlrC
VVTDGDAVRAQEEAIRLAEGFWAVRQRLQAPLVSLADAIAALRDASGTVILVDAADATSSGASGDSNLILHGLAESAYPGRTLAPIVDPGAVEDAMAAGIGNVVQTTVGGKLDPARYPPLSLSARVHLLSDGQFVSESNGALWNAGHTAVLQTEHLTLVVTSRPVNLYDRSLFYAHGQDPRRFDAVIVKSPHCQPHFFDEWAELTINVDVPGATSANLPNLGHTRCVRPIFPLDQNISFTPHAKLFQRSC